MIKHTINNETKTQITILTICVILFILVGHIYPDQIQSKLKHELATIDNFSIDWWSISHFMYFGILGYMLPTHLGELFIIGIIWEIIEDCLASPDNTQMIDCKSDTYTGIKKKFQHFSCNITGLKKDYWYGKVSDIFFNSMGLIVGQYLRINYGQLIKMIKNIN